ncbi:MAG: hypothetical protein KBC00_00805 [Candidatus Levybacteria bacterium]|nr:hypothetical protein [Candidatus Levybacteria bacterium]MBP9814733.1 hypothetical protein [Candidatus Levybacteria bacterium]
MNLETIITNITNFLNSPDIFVKIALVLLELLFLLFTIILARQISSLTKLINQVSFSPVLKFTAYTVIFSTLLLLLVTIFV